MGDKVRFDRGRQRAGGAERRLLARLGATAPPRTTPPVQLLWGARPGTSIRVMVVDIELHHAPPRAYGEGVWLSPSGKLVTVRFAGEHRMLRRLARKMGQTGDAFEVDVESWRIVSVTEIDAELDCA